ncbi:MAG: 50S ribosomal protein L4 [Deltaproteobacteria bacterium]|nr:50S ribosomal protein L4 [Deltaproteobacteria bacterium]
MPVVDVYNLKKEIVGQVTLPDSIYQVPLKQHLVHEVVVSQLANRRSGTACVKARSEIAGSTKKPYRQKGTGRARAGSRKSPVWRGGGTIFGPHPRDFGFQPPKKVRRGAMKVALSAKLMDQELLVLDSIEFPEIKTRQFVQAMTGLALNNALVIIDSQNETLEKSARNVPGFKVLRVDGLNVYDVIKYRHLVLVQSSLPKIEARLLK